MKAEPMLACVALYIYRCAGVFFNKQTAGSGGEPATAAGAKLIYGNPELGRFIRGMLHTVATTARLSNPLTWP